MAISRYIVFVRLNAVSRNSAQVDSLPNLFIKKNLGTYSPFCGVKPHLGWGDSGHARRRL